MLKIRLLFLSILFPIFLFGGIQEKEQKIIDDIQYGREIAGFPNWPNLFGKIETYLNDFPRMKELVALKTFTGKTGWSMDHETVGFVAKNPYNGDYIVSIRGTFTLNLNDWLTNLNTNQKICNHLTCFCKAPADNENEDLKSSTIKVELTQQEEIAKKVHDGFYCYARSMLDQIWGDLFSRLKSDFKKSGKKNFHDFLMQAKISFYGHSLGGAAAQIIAVMIKNELLHNIEMLADEDAMEDVTAEEISEKIKGNIKVFTYEAPRVFTQALAQTFDDFIGKENHFRMIQKMRKTPDYGHPFTNTLVDLLSQDDFPWEDEEWIADPVTQFPVGDFAHTGTLFEIVVDYAKDHDKVGSFLHTSIPKITRKHMEKSLRENLSAF